MLIDDLTALGQKMREVRKNKKLTQQKLSDLSHVSVKQITWGNESFLFNFESIGKDHAHLFRYTYKSRCFSG